MKKRLLFLSLLCLFAFSKNVFAQCENPVGFETIRANKVKADFSATSDLFTNPQGDFGYVVPYTPGLPEVLAIQRAALWVGAYDDQDSLNVSAQILAPFNKKYDFQPGPIDQISGESVPNGCTDFDRVWKVSRGDILALLQDFDDNGVIDNPISTSLLSWPATGNPDFETIMGFPLPDQELAPFFDRNGNGIYEPFNGEYPVIDTGFPSVVPDEMLWCVFNDLHPDHLGTGGSPLGVEVHLLVYAFNCEDNENLNHSIFTRHKIFNKSGHELRKFRAGLRQSVGMGCYFGDFFGCDTLLNTAYFYSEINSEPTLCSNIPDYGENLPVQAITLLNQDLDHFIYYQTTANGSPSPVPSTYIPVQPADFYNYLSGKWKDGTPIIYGGTGYNPMGTDSVNHVFFDNPNDNGWAMLWNFTYELRDVILSTGKPILSTDDVFTLDAAYSFHRAPGADHLENVNVALENIPSIQAIYDSGFNSGCTQFQFCESDCIWPGDANADGIAKEDDLLYLAIGINQGNTGPQRTPPSIIWSPQPGEDWGVNFFDGKEFKHADFNGDGQLDSLDGFVLDLNFYKEKPGFTASQMEAPKKDGELYVDIGRSAISTQDSPLKRYIRARVNLASALAPFQPLSGVSFVVEFDTNMFRAPSVNLPMYSLPLQSFLGSSEELTILVKTLPEKGQIAFGVARKDGQAIGPAFGLMLDVAMELRPDAVISSPDSFEFVKLKVFDAYGATADGEIIPIGVAYDSILVTNLDTIPTAVTDRFSEKLSVDIFPNPNTGTFQLNVYEHNHALEFFIYDLFGKIIWRGKIPPGQTSQELVLKDHLQDGIYFLKVLAKDGRFTTKKLIVK